MTYREEYTFKPEHSVRRRALRAIAVQLYRHPFITLLVLVTLTLLAAWRTDDLRLNVNENLRALSDPTPEAKQAWRAMDMTAPQNDPLTVVIRFPADSIPPDPKTRERIEQLASESFNDFRYFTYAQVIKNPQDQEQPSPLGPAQILPRLRHEDFERIQALATPEGAKTLLSQYLTQTLSEKSPKPGDIEDPMLAKWYADPSGLWQDLARRSAPQPSPFPSVLPHSSEHQSDPRTIVLRLGPKRSSSQLFFCVKLHKFLNEALRAMRELHPEDLAGLEVNFHGRHIQIALRAMQFQTDMIRALIVMTLCLGLLLILAFRKLEAFFFVGLPPLLGLVWTYGLASCFTSDLNLLTAVFPVLLLALGIEFSLQIYHRFIEELYRERRYYPALGTAYTEAGRGIVVCTIMTAAIFFSLHLSSLQILRELATVCGLGIISMALAPLVVLPPMAALKSRLAQGAVTPVATYDFGLNRLSAAVLASPRTTLTLGLLVTAYLAFFTQDIKINRDLGLDLGTLVSEAAPAPHSPPRAPRQRNHLHPPGRQHPPGSPRPQRQTLLQPHLPTPPRKHAARLNRLPQPRSPLAIRPIQSAPRPRARHPQHPSHQGIPSERRRNPRNSLQFFCPLYCRPRKSPKLRRSSEAHRIRKHHRRRSHCPRSQTHQPLRRRVPNTHDSHPRP